MAFLPGRIAPAEESADARLSGRSEPHHMGHIRPFALRPGGIQSIPSNILRSTGRDMLCQLQQETGHREGFNLSLEEVVIRGVGDDGCFAIFLDTEDGYPWRSGVSACRY